MPAVTQQKPPAQTSRAARAPATPDDKPPPKAGKLNQTPLIPLGGILDQIEPIRAPEGGLKIALFGKSGSGKTTFACTFPKPLLLIGAEDGRRSVHDVAGVEYVPLREGDHLTALLDAQREGRFPAKVRDRIRQDRFETVVLDSATFLQDLVIKQVLGVVELPPQLSWGTLGQSQWGDVALGVKSYLRPMVDLLCHTITICQEREFNNDGTGEVLAPYVNCALTPSVTGWLGPAVDYLLQCFQRVGKKKTKTVKGGLPVEIEEDVVQFCLRTGAHPVYSTKFRRTRSSKLTLPDAVVDPSFEKLFALVEAA